MKFRNRAEAGRLLARKLLRLKEADPLVYALPRGGVAVAAEIALALDAPLDLILVKKLGVPWQPELAMGALADGARPLVVRNPEILAQAGVGEEEFKAICETALDEIERRRWLYLKNQPRTDIEGRSVIVVDDGIATGATILAALRSIGRQAPRWLVLAVPVAPPETLAGLAGETDEIVCLDEPRTFDSIGEFYEDFSQLSDAEVIAILSEVRACQAFEDHNI